MNRNTVYIERFNLSDIPRKIKAIKAMEAYNKLDHNYHGVSDKIDSIASVLEEIYPLRWDVIMKENRERRILNGVGISAYTTCAQPFTIEFVIWFPVVNITNSKSERHTIRDLYIRLNPSYAAHGNEFTFIDFDGKRMAATKEEIYSSYQHSHLPPRNYLVADEGDEDRSGFEFRRFCLGDSEINQVLAMLRSRYNEGTFKLLLLQLEEYVNWESIEGTPHIFMANVLGNNILYTIGVNNIVNYSQELIRDRRNRTDKHLDFCLVGNKIKIIQNEKLEDFLRLFEDHNAYDINIIARKSATGEYYAYRFFSEGEITTNHLSTYQERKKVEFIFRKERVRFNIVVEENQQEDRTFYLHKQIKEHVTETIEHEIQTQRLRSYITKSLNTFKSIPENTRQNRLFMPSDS